MQFYNGVTDSLQTAALSRIKWQIRYNVFQGSCPDDDLFRSNIPGAERDSLGNLPEDGEFGMISSPISGGQESTISWYSDVGTIYFQIREITAPQ